MDDTNGVVTQVNLQAIDAVLVYRAFIDTNKLVTTLEAEHDKSRLSEANKAKPTF